MSNHTVALTCPNCNAPLDVQPGETVVKCAYCGSEVQVPQAPPPRQSDPYGRGDQPASAAASAYAEPLTFPTAGTIPLPRQVSTASQTVRWIGCLGILLVIGLCALVIVGASNLIFRSSSSFDLAMKLAQADPKVAAAFGTPLQPGLFISGRISSSGNRSHVNYDIPISGPRRSGTLHVQGDSTADGWTLALWAHYQDHGEDIAIHVATEQ